MNVTDWLVSIHRVSACLHQIVNGVVCTLNFSFLPVTGIFILFQVIDETLDVKEVIFNSERVGGLEEEPVWVYLQNLMTSFMSI